MLRTTAAGIAACMVLVGAAPVSAGVQELAAPTAAETAAVQVMLVARQGNGAALWAQQRAAFVEDIGDGTVISARDLPGFRRSYLRTAMAPAATAEIDRAFLAAFVGAMSEAERADPASISAERQAELAVAADAGIRTLLHNVHTAGIFDACQEGRVQSHFCMASTIMVHPTNPWTRVKRR